MVDNDHGPDETGEPFTPMADAEHALAVPEDAAPVSAEAGIAVVEVVDGEEVDEIASGAPVDHPHRDTRSLAARADAAHGVRRRPVVAPWLTNSGELATVARWVAGHVGHHVAYHAVRVPQYGALFTLRSPRGVWLVLSLAWAWLVDREGHPLRQHAVQHNDADNYLKLVRERNARVRARLVLTGASLVALALASLALAIWAPWWAKILATAGAVLALGIAGTPADRPVVSPAVVVYRVQRLTSDQVIRALTSIGIAGMTTTARAAPPIGFPEPIARDGPGWRAVVDLPHGITATDVIERRDRLASGLRRPTGCVWPEPVHDEHAGRLVLWVGDVDMAKAKQLPWPLHQTRRSTLFAMLPFGTDQRGRPVGIDLMYANLLIGGLPGSGKTYALRQVVLGAALDATCELRLFELKGSGDLDAFEPIAHHHGSGPDDATAAACIASLREVYADLETRAATIKKLAKAGRAPQNKITPALAAERSLRLWPLLFVIDECQELFEHAEFGKEAERLAVAIIKRGRALGIILVLATQRPDKDSLPKSISDNVGIRFCLRVMGQPANDMILGTTAYRNGIRATMLRPSDKGIGYLVGAFDEPVIVRGYDLDGDAAKRVVVIARGLREQAGTVTGAAAGQHQHVFSVLDDVFVISGGAERLWTSVILQRLGALRPEVYGGWAPEQLAAALRPFDGRPQQVWATTREGDGANRQGYILTQLSRGDRP